MESTSMNDLSSPPSVQRLDKEEDVSCPLPSPAQRVNWERLLLICFLGTLMFTLALSGGLLVAQAISGEQGSFGSGIFPTIGMVIIPLLLIGAFLGERSRRAGHRRIETMYQNRLDQLQQRLAYREDLLKLVADHQPGAIAVFDRHNRYWFVNKKTADGTSKQVGEIIGQPPIRVLGNEMAGRLELRLAEARAAGHSVSYTDRIIDKKGALTFVQSHFEALGPFMELADGVLVSEENITPLIVERERRERMLRQVIDTLIAVVDRRDPYAAGHSAHVGQLARAISEDMGLDARHADSAEIAGSLMNFGKVLVARSVLTKTTPLTPEELQRVRDSIMTSADILSIIDFDGPVVPTLRQVQERYDGTGVPTGLLGDTIMLTARIVTVANAFVALVSPRAHREGLYFKDALDLMAKESGLAYDPRVLAALSNYIEIHASALDWLKLSKQG